MKVKISSPTYDGEFSMFKINIITSSETFSLYTRGESAAELNYITLIKLFDKLGLKQPNQRLQK